MATNPKPARSTTKNAAGRWPPETQARAVDLYTTQGLATAATETGIPKSTIRRWAKNAGVDPAASRARSTEQTRAATEASVARRAARLAEAREELTERVVEAGLEALELERLLLAAHVRAVTEAATNQGKVSEATSGLLAAAVSGHRLSEVVGSRTRATHDLLRLLGDGGDQPADAGLTIVFATTAPAPAAHGGPVPVIVDLPALEAPR